MKLCIDAGHGRDSRRAGVYDSGACRGKLMESLLVLPWAQTLADECRRRGVPCFEVRPTDQTSAPLAARVKRALQAGCTHFISFHVNDAETAAAHGVETLYSRAGCKDFATLAHNHARAALGLHDRGLKLRPELAVLKFPGSCCLLELGFIGNALDVAAITSKASLVFARAFLRALVP